LPITLDHVLRTESLPRHHRDPFDRLLIAQSIEQGWPIVTADPVFARYSVDVIW
jgi:PIN domain nuclease of toxin-antitoxin system